VHKATIESTPYGPVAVLWKATEDGPRIVRVLLSTSGDSAVERAARQYPAAFESSCEEIDSITSRIRRLLAGEPVDFRLDAADLSICGTFQQRVLRAEHAIPRGRVSTYRLIAAHLGTPKAARAVGNALATNPFPLIVPCHRAIRSGGSLGGYQGGQDMKRSLLCNEGIAFDASGRAQVSDFHYG
jgi:methylated-DNA-[protein]-cysteine S-methyltransferase